jgi:hypothetical protein
VVGTALKISVIVLYFWSKSLYVIFRFLLEWPLYLVGF